jgi:hypothetical protein
LDLLALFWSTHIENLPKKNTSDEVQINWKPSQWKDKQQCFHLATNKILLFYKNLKWSNKVLYTFPQLWEQIVSQNNSIVLLNPKWFIVNWLCLGLENVK